MRQRFVWVVEVRWLDGFSSLKWNPTVGVGLTREDGRNALRGWKYRNVSAQFRLVKYLAAR